MKLQMSAESNGTVDLSVVIVSTGSHSSLRASLNAILANDLRNVEILVVDCCSEGPMPELADAYPSVRFFYASRKACVPFLAGTGLRRATGEIIALTDTSSLVSSSWIANIIRAHASESLVIGGSVEPNGRMNLLDWSAYFCDYGQFMHPLKAGSVGVLPGNNISIKRSALAKSAELVKPAFKKTLWCEKIRSDGTELICDPAIETHFASSSRIVPFLARRYRNARCFAGMRSKEMTKLKRLLYLVGSPLLSIILLQRTISAVVPKRRYTKQLILSSPFLVAAVIFWSIGEACGYLTGSCQLCARPLAFTSSGGAEAMEAAA